MRRTRLIAIYKPSVEKSPRFIVSTRYLQEKALGFQLALSKDICHVSTTEVADGAVTEHPISCVPRDSTRLIQYVSRVP